MKPLTIALVIFISSLVICIMIAGCSGGDPVNSVPVTATEKAALDTANHNIWGLWQFNADLAAQTLEITPLREVDFHLNALVFLEPPPLVNLTLESLEFNGNIIEADIGLRHPFLGLTEFTGFDVCGIFITNGSTTGFSDTDLRMAGEGDTRLLNPDGYSRWWNPAEFPLGATMLNYKDGLLGTADAVGNYNSTLNGYKYFCDDLDADEGLNGVALEHRGMFSAGQKNIRHYTIEMGAGLVFNYAVDACWQYPTGSKPWQAPDDFPLTANRAESWRVNLIETENTLWNDGVDNGGDLVLQVDVYDWFNADLNTVKVESLGNFAIASSSTAVGSGAGYSTYEIEILGATPAEVSIPLFISVESENIGYGNLLPDKPVTSYFTHAVSVGTEPPNTSTGWARTWGGSAPDLGQDVAVDESGNSYTAGYFNEKADFDPGIDEEIHGSNGSNDVFLVKLDASGNFIWCRTWGGTGSDLSHGVAVDTSGNVYIAGDFSGVVDFNPGVGIENHTSNGSNDAFLLKLDSSGNFIWARTWGGISSEAGWGVAVDTSGNVSMTGLFNGTVNFDTGGGVDNHTSNGGSDIYLTRFDSSGAFIWAKTWGGSSSEGGYGVAYDNPGNIFVTGYFNGSVNFNPWGSGDIHNAVGGGDVFLSKFDTAGGFLWAKTWGGTSWEMSNDVATDGTGNAYVIGYYSEKVDFDPGAGVDTHTSNGSNDTFLSKFGPTGTFVWARTWGGIGTDFSLGVATDISGNIFASGNFNETVDFDPGPGEDLHHSNGLYDSALSKFDSSGNFLWAKTWGSDAMVKESGSGVTTDAFGNVLVTGWWGGKVDFDPGTGEDWHTSSGESDVFLSKFLPDGSW